MNSRDIYIKVGEKMAEDGYIQNPFGIITDNKGQIIKSMSNALIEYSYEKLNGIDITESITMDLGVLLDTLEPLIPEYEKSKFYESYVHCMLNIYNNLEQSSILWNIVSEDNVEDYPRFAKEGSNLCFFQTVEDYPTKETAIWLHQYLLEKYNCKALQKKDK